MGEKIVRKTVTVTSGRILFGNDKYFVYFVKNVNGLNTILHKKKIKLSQSKISYKHRTYPLDVGNIAYRFKNHFYTFIDIDKGQINFNPINSELDSEFLDTVISQHIAGQIVSALEKTVSLGFLNILLYIIVGVSIGYLIGNFLPFPNGG